MIPYIPFRDILWMHWLIGMGICYGAYMWANEHGHERKMFKFGGDVFSLGQRKMWVKWFVFAYLVELVTSLFYVPGGQFYTEIALSPLEAGAMLVGMFMMDRILAFMSTSPSPGDLGIDVDGLKAKVKTSTAKVKDIFSSDKATKRTERKQKEDIDFQNLTRNH